MSDLISRRAAIDALEFGITYAKVYNKETGEVKELFSEANEELRKAVERIKQLPSAQQKPRWIPVSERLPETDGYYLVTIKTFGWNGEQYEDVDIARYERKNGWLKADKCTAWMPLPKPYKGEES